MVSETALNCPIWSRKQSDMVSETALNRAPQLWSSLVPADLKSLPNVNLFKSRIKHWERTECPCKVCKTYLKNIGYV